MKHYFITYQATNDIGHYSQWNKCINTSPMEFILKKEKSHYERGSGEFSNFVIINTLEITLDEFHQFGDKFI